jgi:hypothetical protein
MLPTPLCWLTGTVRYRYVVSADPSPEEVLLDDPGAIEGTIKSAIVSLWRRETELSSFERMKLMSLMLNLKAFWLSSCPPAPPESADPVGER